MMMPWQQLSDEDGGKTTKKYWILFFDVTENFPDSLKLRQITNEHTMMWSSVLLKLFFWANQLPFNRPLIEKLPKNLAFRR